MKGAYAVRRTVPRSAEIEAWIEQMLSVGVGESSRESLSELAKLGARLISRRAVEDEFDAWLGRARYERRPSDQPEEGGEEAGLRNGFGAGRVQTAEGELEIEIPQVRQAAETFASNTASRMCEELRERFDAFKRRDLYEIRLVALFLDATFIAVRPDGPKEGVLVAWGFTEDGERIVLAVSLGVRESFEDWQTLGRDLISRGLGAPMLIVADGAPGLSKAIEQCWPASDRQRCCVHRARNLYAKLPDRERERVRHAYWQTLEAISEQDAKAASTRSQVSSTRKGSPPPLAASLTISTRSWCTCATRCDIVDDGARTDESVKAAARFRVVLEPFLVLVAEIGG
jgi:putative transposase